MEESDFHGRGHSSIIVYFGNSSDLTWIVESNKRFPFKKYSAVKDISIWQKEALKGLVHVFSTDSVQFTAKATRTKMKNLRTKE